MGLFDGANPDLLESVWTLLPVVLASARAAGFVAVAPLFGPEVDWRFRVVFGAMIAAATAPLVAPRIEMVAAAAIPWAIVWEIAAGALVALPAALLLGAARQAGELAANGSGLGAAATLDPASGENLTPFGRLYGLVALAAFLAFDGPFRMVQALVASFDGPTPRLDSALVDTFCQTLTWALEITLQTAAPAALAIVLASAVMAWVGKVAPASSAIVVAPAARIIVGLVVVFLFLAVLADGLQENWRRILERPAS